MIKKTLIGRFVGTLLSVVGTAAMAAALASQPAAAQRLDGAMPSSIGIGRATIAAPGVQLHAVNPSMSLSSPASSPLQEQMQDDYATQLMNAQRQLLQQNPSGSGPTELSIRSQLNGYMGPR